MNGKEWEKFIYFQTWNFHAEDLRMWVEKRIKVSVSLIFSFFCPISCNTHTHTAIMWEVFIYMFIYSLDGTSRLPLSSCICWEKLLNFSIMLKIKTSPAATTTDGMKFEYISSSLFGCHSYLGIIMIIQHSTGCMADKRAKFSASFRHRHTTIMMLEMSKSIIINQVWHRLGPVRSLCVVMLSKWPSQGRNNVDLSFFSKKNLNNLPQAN